MGKKNPPSPRTSLRFLSSHTVHVSSLILLFAAAVAVLVAIFLNFPSLRPQHRAALKLPANFSDVQTLSSIFGEYTHEHYWSVVGAFGAIYVFLQAFSIPGSVFLSFLAGALFGFLRGFLLVCSTATVGAFFSYLLSHYLARGMVLRLFPEKIALLGSELARHRSHLLNYLLFLRITPFLPNWFINLAAPILGVPASTFILGTFFGIMPATFFAVRAGLTLQNIKRPRDVFDAYSIATLAICAVLSILPTLKPVQVFLDSLFNRKSSKTHKDSLELNNHKEIGTKRQLVQK